MLNNVMFIFKLPANLENHSFTQLYCFSALPLSCIPFILREADKHVSFHGYYQTLPKTTLGFSPNTKHQTKNVLKNQLKM